MLKEGIFRSMGSVLNGKGTEMTFNDYWKEVEATGILSRVAIQMLPTSFSEELKEQMMKSDPEDVAKACQKAINEINRGSVDTIETLIRKQL